MSEDAWRDWPGTRKLSLTSYFSQSGNRDTPLVVEPCSRSVPVRVMVFLILTPFQFFLVEGRTFDWREWLLGSSCGGAPQVCKMQARES